VLPEKKKVNINIFKSGIWKRADDGFENQYINQIFTHLTTEKKKNI
jgi:hypothetical protein